MTCDFPKESFHGPFRSTSVSVWLLAAAIALLNLGSPAAGAAPTNSAESREEHQEHFAAGVRELREVLRIPGLSVAVLKDGNVIYRQKEGFSNLEKQTPISDENLFQVASITKTFTANLVMQYEEAHLASLDDFALKYRFIDTRFGWPYNIDPNARLRHFLSHTSEDGIGRSFIYNGQRFNYIYGVFEAAGNYPPNTEAYSQELKKRIFVPLKMAHSLTGFPKSRSDPSFANIATPYIYDREKARFVEDVVNYQWTQAFPATGIITTIDDLAKYAASYETHSLISVENYAKITTPQRLADGSTSPYGIGWFTESFGGTRIHWHYGHADSYAALFVRVPESHYTFIFLSNSNAASDALRLGAGHIWQSPFVTLFLRDFVFAGKSRDENIQHRIDTEYSIGSALFSHYAAKLYHSVDDAPRAMESLFAENPARFEEYDAALIMLLSEIESPHAHVALERLISAFERYAHPQPYVSTDLAEHFERLGDHARAFHFYQQVADSTVFETWNIGIEACKRCGTYLIKRGKLEAGRRYFWRAVNRLKNAGADDKAIQVVIDQMNTTVRVGGP